MDLSSEEEMLEVETVEEELDSDVMSVSSLNDNFYVKDYDDKQRARDQVIEKINSIFGCKISNLSKVNNLKDSLEKRLHYLDEKHDLTSSSTPAELNSSFGRGEEMTRQVEDITRRKEELLLQAASIREKVKNFGADNAGMLSELGIVSGVGHYWVWCNLVENCNTELVLALETGTHTEMVDSFNSLNEINTSLKESKCENLKNYVSSTTKYWRRSIELKIVAALEEAITSIGWPFVQLSDTKKHQEAVKSVSIQELQELVKCLILISDDRIDADCDKDQMFVTQPMKIFLKPLRRRFKYHFLGTKSTNNPAKPEWYTTQLILWASLHSTFLDSNIQPVYDELGLAVPAKLELGYGLVCLARDKLSLDLPLILTDDVLLAHSIDEAIVLARDLAAKLQYSSAQPSPLSPLTRGQIFSRWINMERKFAFEKLDNVFTGDGAWTPDIGDNLVPSAAQSFLAVLLSVTERYKYLPLSQHRLQFLQLQLELLEDFRLRLVQLLRPENEEPLQSNLCPILCTVHHLMTILASWAETPFFLQLEHQKQEQVGGEMTGTVFDEAISKLEYLLTDMISTINNWIMYSVKSNSRQYRKEVKWFSYKITVSGVQPAFCSVLQDISFNLETASKMLPESVFTKVWQELAVKIGKFICEEVILVNSFNVDGAKQLESDLRQGLLPIFGEFTLRPEAHFPVLMDSVKLLNTSTGSLLLLLETLEPETLRELGVTRLTVNQAQAVISTRVELL